MYESRIKSKWLERFVFGIFIYTAEKISVFNAKFIRNKYIRWIGYKAISLLECLHGFIFPLTPEGEKEIQQLEEESKKECRVAILRILTKTLEKDCGYDKKTALCKAQKMLQTF